ncbi:hypothetical protein J4E08_11685 [Sagittula sp. NFXS13]|uniref:hypothetical protein n=1 Tax=Sagittula sp. NFXS13 TaxID=2819095 RepID=UPI0032DFF8B2
MADPTQPRLQEIERERAAMFRGPWIAKLARGELSLGETFWGGFLGMQLILMPLWLVLVAFLPAFFPSVGWATRLAFFVLQAVWTAVVTQAVLRVAPKSYQAGGWRWGAMILSVVILLQVLVLLGMWLAGAL